MRNFRAIISILCGILSFGSSIYAGFSNGGFGSAILIALVAAPASYICILLTNFVTNIVLLKLLEKANSIDKFIDKILTKFMLIMTVPAHIITTAFVPYVLYTAPVYKEQTWIWIPIGIILCPLCYAIVCFMTYYMGRISSYMGSLIRLKF